LLNLSWRQSCRRTRFPCRSSRRDLAAELLLNRRSVGLSVVAQALFVRLLSLLSGSSLLRGCRLGRLILLLL
jgi:hypothetical protein